MADIAQVAATKVAKLRPADQKLLNACKLGDIAAVKDSLDEGANPSLGVTFMYKVHNLFPKEVSIAMLTLLKDRQRNNTATPSGRTTPAAGATARRITLPPTTTTTTTTTIEQEQQPSSNSGGGSNDAEWNWNGGVDTSASDGVAVAATAVQLARRMSLNEVEDSDESEEEEDEEELRAREEFEAEVRRKIEAAGKRKRESEASIMTSSDGRGSPLIQELPHEESAVKKKELKKKNARRQSKDNMHILMQGSEEDWYAGTTTKSKCLKGLKGKDNGDFLVRKSSKKAYELMAKDAAGIVTFDINFVQPADGSPPYLDLKGRKHATLDEAIMGAFRRHVISPLSGKLLYLNHGIDIGRKKKPLKYKKLSAEHNTFSN